MKWLEDYQLFLFDFDGLLVNTEELHYKAYQITCEQHGFDLGIDFPTYCTYAHYHADSLRDMLLTKFPDLKKNGWNHFYTNKTTAINQLILEGAVELMPGVESFLLQLQQMDKKRCVVTHSPDQLIQPIREKHPILKTIPVWLTREFYTHPKPNPECYQKAIERLAEPGDKIIGFEDSPRGMRALMGTEAQPVMISAIVYPEAEEFRKKGAFVYPTFDAMPKSRLS